MIPTAEELLVVSTTTYSLHVELANVAHTLLTEALEGRSYAKIHVQERFIDEILKDLESANYKIDDNPYAFGNLIVITVRW